MSETYGPRENVFNHRERLEEKDIDERTASGESLENFDIRGLNLAGKNLEKKSFRGSDVRDLILYTPSDETAEIEDVRTNIRETNWRECVLGEQYSQIDFRFVDAEGAAFGYFETLRSRDERYRGTKGPPIEDTGGLFNFDGRGGNFRNTSWVNVDFGGFEGGAMEAMFYGADFSGAVFEGCNLMYIDFSEVVIDKIRIVNPTHTKFFTISHAQVDTVFAGIEVQDDLANARLKREAESKGKAAALREVFGINVV